MRQFGHVLHCGLHQSRRTPRQRQAVPSVLERRCRTAFVFRMGSLLSITGSDAAQREMAPTLNERQRAYLQATFDTDQAIETDMRSIPYSPFHERPKASD